jgi:MFS family permease
MANEAMADGAATGITGNRADSFAVRATLLLTSTLTVMAGAIIAPSLPAMQAHFAHVPNAALWARLVLTLPALFIALGAPFAGQIVDRFGRKRLLIISALLYAMAGTTGYYMHTLPQILAGRALLGFAVAGLMTCVTTLIGDYYAGPSRGKFLGLQAAFMGLGGTIYTTVGGLVATYSWRNPFLVYLAVLLILPLMVLILFEPPRQAPGIERHALDEPARLPRIIFFLYGLTLLVQIAFYLIPVQLPFYLKEHFGAGAQQAGIAIAVMTTCFSVGSLISPHLARLLERRSLFAFGFGLTAAGYALIGTAQSYPLLYAGLIAGGLGFGFVVPYQNGWLISAAPASLRGRAAGGLTTFVFLGQFLSPILFQPFLAHGGPAEAYRVMGLILLVAALIAVGMRFLPQFDRAVE